MMCTKNFKKRLFKQSQSNELTVPFAFDFGKKTPHVPSTNFKT